jgi:hypothetical protein
VTARTGLTLVHIKVTDMVEDVANQEFPSYDVME